MGRIGKVIKSFIAKLSGSGTNAQFASVEEFYGDQRTAQVMGPCNEDFAPPLGCKTLDLTMGLGRGYLVTVAYHNQLIAPIAKHGERRLFSTNQAGDTVKSEVFLKQDGEILVQNENITIIAHADGFLEITTSGISQFTSEKTIFKNDIEVEGNMAITGVITGANVFGGADSDDHIHSQGNDSGGASEQDVGGPHA